MSKENVEIPMNLQFFAESSDETQDNPTPENETQDNPTLENETQDNPTPENEEKTDKPKEPTVQELMVELAKLKRAQEKAASEAAEYKKKYNAKLSEKEKADEEKARREAEKDEQFQQLLRENKINKLEKYYLGELKYTPDEAAKMAVAEVDEDFDAKLKIQLAVQKRQKKEYEAEFIKSRPQLNAGAGEKQITKEQFDNMGMAEKSKLYNENKAEYDRLMGM